LIDDDGEVHLNGFATSQLAQRGFLGPEILGDPTYAAPECFAAEWNDQPPPLGLRSKCNIYSLGLILCELIFAVAFGSQCSPAHWLKHARKAGAPVSVEAGRDRPEMADSHNRSGAAGRRAAVLTEGPRAPDGVEETVPVLPPSGVPAASVIVDAAGPGRESADGAARSPGESRWHFPVGINVELGNLTLRCCSDNPEERPTISEFLTVLSRH
jgi:hypothetical protein